MRPYQEIRKTLNTFDVLCCSHKDLFWRLIGHTAMVVKDYDRDLLMVWQSTTQYAGQKGTSLMVLSDWLEQYPGKVYVRRVKITTNGTHSGRLDSYIREHRGDPYPNLKAASGLWYMIASALDIGGKITENHPIGSAKHCAARIADTYQKCGLIIPECNVDEIEPDNWRDYYPLHVPIDGMLTKGVMLMPEIRIK